MSNPGFKIAEYRNRKRWTQTELAARVGMAQANLSNIEKGKRDLTVSTLLRIATALEVRPSELIEEEMSSPSLALTRPQIEGLAQAVVEPQRKASAEIKKWAPLFRIILPQAPSRVSVRKAQQAWVELRRHFSSQEIQGICRRIEDARQRSYAKTAD